MPLTDEQRAKLPTALPVTYEVGRLGAVFDERSGKAGATASQLDMIERRILRIEMLLRRHNIELEQFELPR